MTKIDTNGLRLGDAVKVTERCRYHEDWRGVAATVTGLWLEKSGKINVEIDDGSSRYDGFEPEELERTDE